MISYAVPDGENCRIHYVAEGANYAYYVKATAEEGRRIAASISQSDDTTTAANVQKWLDQQNLSPASTTSATADY